MRLKSRSFALPPGFCQNAARQYFDNLKCLVNVFRLGSSENYGTLKRKGDLVAAPPPGAVEMKTIAKARFPIPRCRQPDEQTQMQHLKVKPAPGHPPEQDNFNRPAQGLM
jgi:hypothetical protein